MKEIKTRRAENEIIDTSEFFTDEPVIDIYLSSHAETWRVGAMVSTSHVSVLRRP